MCQQDSLSDWHQCLYVVVRHGSAQVHRARRAPPLSLPVAMGRDSLSPEAEWPSPESSPYDSPPFPDNGSTAKSSGEGEGKGEGKSTDKGESKDKGKSPPLPDQGTSWGVSPGSTAKSSGKGEGKGEGKRKHKGEGKGPRSEMSPEEKKAANHNNSQRAKKQRAKQQSEGSKTRGRALIQHSCGAPVPEETSPRAENNYRGLLIR